MKTREYTAVWTDTILSMKKPATIASMRSHIRKIDESFGSVTLDSLTEGMIQANISKLSKEMSPRATRNYWGTFRLILTRAQREGLIQSVPVPVLPKGGTRPQTIFGKDTLIQLSRREVLWFMFAETGLRVGEVLGLQVGDFDFTNRTLTVNRSVFDGQPQEPKTSNGYRTISLSTRLVEKISNRNDRSNAENGDYLFRNREHRPWRQPQLLKKLHRDLAELGCPVSGFHAFRRGNATLLAEMGCPVKIISTRHGRQTGDLTVDCYIGVRPGHDREWAEKLGEVLYGQ